MKNFFLGVIFFFASIFLTVLLFVIASAFTVKYTLSDENLNSRVSEILPVKEIVEDIILQETGVTYTLQENDEQVIKDLIGEFLFELTIAFNQNQTYTPNLELKFKTLATNLSDPVLKNLIQQEVLQNPDVRAEFLNAPEINSLMEQGTTLKNGTNYLIYAYLFFAIVSALILLLIDQKKAVTSLRRTFLMVAVPIFSIGLFLVYITSQNHIPQQVVSDLVARGSIGLIVFGIFYGFISAGLTYYLRHNYQN